MDSILALTGAGGGVLGLVLALIAYNRAARTSDQCRNALRHVSGDGGPLDARAVRDVSIVRYDALKEMSGQLSFSLALLNSDGDGVVITSINSRTETRTYAKIVQGGKGVQPLSPEEDRAVRSARLGQGPPVLLGETDDLVRSPDTMDEGIRVLPDSATA
ncbi:MAG TPA: DUF4446 family protein [Streptosporangiaceae bacterium]|jgi:hypothetical protein